MNINPQVRLNNQLTLNPPILTSDSNAKPMVALPKITSNIPVKNIQKTMFQQFRNILHNPTVYNQDEINALIHDQEDLVNKK